MSETLKIERLGRTPVTTIELVHSPDDGGYYLQNWDFRTKKHRCSVVIYPSRQEAIQDWSHGTVKWEEWY